MIDKSKYPIGIFDSGVGGLTVVKSIHKILPHENIVYFGDTARVPYGSKSIQTVRKYAEEDAEFLSSKNVKMIVVACNTVSSVALDIVQKKSNVLVCGVIFPGAKEGAKVSQNSRIGVIGTKATVQSNAYLNAIKQIKSDANVISKSCPLFVSLVEENFIEHKATEIIAKEYLFSFTREKIDTLILGCTHYPLLANTIQNVLGKNVKLIDSGIATAYEVKTQLEEKKLLNQSKEKPNLQFFVSDDAEKFSEIGEKFLGQKLGKVRRTNFSFNHQ